MVVAECGDCGQAVKRLRAGMVGEQGGIGGVGDEKEMVHAWKWEAGNRGENAVIDWHENAGLVQIVEC
jgi:hypothetical protein